MIPNEQIELLEKIISERESTLSYKVGGDLADRLSHVLRQFQSMADNSIFEMRRVLSDVKTQFKALEIIVEGLTSQGMNHSEKRVIANYMITMLRGMVDRIDQTDISYTSQTFERYNLFRSQTPERRLYEDRADLTRALEQNKQYLEDLKKKHPEIFKEEENDLPY